MKTVWDFFASVWLTIALSVIICVDAAWGSLVSMGNPQFFRALDQTVLINVLAHTGGKYIKYTLWIYVLIFLMALFALNTAVCTADKVYAIIKKKKPPRSIFPHIVHIGFLIALLGHLAGSTMGFKSGGNIVYKNEMTPVPGEKGLFVRLDDFSMTETPDGDVDSIDTKITVFRDTVEVKSGDITINGPLFYRGIAFYHADQGVLPTGAVIDVNGERGQLKFDGTATKTGGVNLRLNKVYPDFALDGAGRPYSRSNETRNPYIEIASEDGRSALISVAAPGGSAMLGGSRVKISEFILTPYVVLTINKDPGISLIIAGSTILVIGMVMLLFFRGERAEIIRIVPADDGEL